MYIKSFTEYSHAIKESRDSYLESLDKEHKAAELKFKSSFDKSTLDKMQTILDISSDFLPKHEISPRYSSSSNSHLTMFVLVVSAARKLANHLKDLGYYAKAGSLGHITVNLDKGGSTINFGNQPWTAEQEIKWTSKIK